MKYIRIKLLKPSLKETNTTYIYSKAIVTIPLIGLNDMKY